jgi:hypothetical protein
VIIAPGFTFPAPPVKHPARLVPAVSYTAAYNVLDFPVGSVPITRVIPQDEVCQYLLNYFWSPSIFDRYGKNFSKLFKMKPLCYSTDHKKYIHLSIRPFKILGLETPCKT